MSQASWTIANGAGSAVRSAINLILAAIRSNNSDASTFPAGAVQGQSFTQTLSATQQLEWRYDGTQWVLERLIDPTTHKVYPANVRKIHGLTVSNNVTDATNDIDIAAGWTAADSDGCPLVLTSALTKRLDAAWTVGTNQGGLDTGSIANTTYHVWLIRRPDTGVVDVLFSASASAPTMPTNYTQKRRIGSIIRSGGAIVPVRQFGDRFLRDVIIRDVAASNPGASAVTATLSLPVGIVTTAIIHAHIEDLTAAVATSALFTALAQTDTTPAGTAFNLFLEATGGVSSSSSVMEIPTNASAQIRYRLSASNADITVFILTLGWIDRRGQDD